MPADQRQEDHDLLIRIHEQLQRVQNDQADFKAEFKTLQTQNDERLKSLEKFFTLARNGFAFFVAIGALLQFALLIYEKMKALLSGK